MSLKARILKPWLTHRDESGEPAMIRAQIRQTLARIAFACLALAYLYWHSPAFAAEARFTLPAAALYLLLQLAGLAFIRRRPFSLPRSLLYPLVDTAAVAMAMLIDGGHASGLYFLLLIITLGNGLRWGTAMLIYAQLLGILALIAVGITGVVAGIGGFELPLLLWQLAALAIVPLYAYLVAERAGRENTGAGSPYALLDHAPLPSFVFDLDDAGRPRILYANHAIGATHHEAAESLIGEPPERLVLLEDGRLMMDFCRRQLQQRAAEPQSLLLRGRSRRDQPLALMCIASVFEQHKGICCMVDLSHTESLQGELSAMHRLLFNAALISGVAHGFRNILTNIIGTAEMLALDCSDATTRASLETIIESGEKGEKLLSELVGLSPPPAKATEPLRLSEAMLQPLLELARIRLPAHIGLGCRVEQPLPACSMGLAEMETLLLAMIDNAVRAIADTGEIELRLFADSEHPLAKGGAPALCLEVSDDGCGIAADDLDHIFESFWSTRHGQGGYGLGLAVVRRSARNHQGAVAAHSEPGRGGRITVHLPAARSA